MKWNLIRNGANSGKYNMEFDMLLADSCKEDEAFLRIYRWNPFCISLGANQSISEIDKTAVEKDGIDVVSRPTGGQAILHAEELTYSVVVPTKIQLSPKELYKKISAAIIRGLGFYDMRLTEVSLETEQPKFSEIRKSFNGQLCFASTAKNEITYRGKKLVGSAQRKMNTSLLQHGSILVDKFHRQLPLYLVSKNVTPHLLHDSTIEIQTILQQEVNYQKLADMIVLGFEEEFKIDIVNSSEHDFKPTFSFEQ